MRARRHLDASRVRVKRRAFASALVVLTLCASPVRASHEEFTLISRSSGGAHANAWSAPRSISGDGRFVVFVSPASTLVPNDTNGLQDLFVHDRADVSTERVTVSTEGEQANAGAHGGGGISDDGRLVVFTSAASNLVPDDADGLVDVFIRDRATATTTRILHTGGEGVEKVSSPHLSADGRSIAFEGARGVYRRDLTSGVTTLVAEPSGPFGFVALEAISDDGRFLAVSASDDLTGADGPAGLFVVDRLKGGVERATINDEGAPLIGFTVHSVDLASDGRTIAFEGYYACATACGTNYVVRVTDLDTRTGAEANVDTFGRGVGQYNTTPSLSADGRYLLWTAHRFTGDGDRHGVYLRDLHSRTTIAVHGNEDPIGYAAYLSSDGSTVTFESALDDLVASDTNATSDTFVWSPCDRGMHNDGPATGPLHEQVTPHAPTQSFTVDNAACHVLRPHGL